MRHPPAFDGRHPRPAGRRDPPSSTHPPMAEQGTDLADQIAERLEHIADTPTSKLPGQGLMSRLSGLEAVPATVRIRPQDYPELEATPTAPPPAPAPSFAALMGLPAVAEHEPQAAAAAEPEGEPGSGSANDNYPRLLQAVRARRRKRLIAGLRNAASWVVTLGVAGAIIGAAAFFMVGTHLDPEPAPPLVQAVTVPAETPVAPAAPMLVTAPAPVERQASPSPPAAPQPAESGARPRTLPKLVKPVEPVQSRKKTATKSGKVKAGSPSPDRAPAARAAARSGPGE